MSIYKNKFVLFLDILGWGNLITETQEQGEQHEHLLSVLAHLKEISDFQKAASTVINDPILDIPTEAGVAEVNSIHFSDSIVFSFSPNAASFTLVFASVSGLSVTLAKHGYFVRGGMDYGKIHNKDNLIFGPALNCAYKLESELAINPRIILSKEALEQVQLIESLPESFLHNDEDYYYLNNLQHVAEVQGIMGIIKSNQGKYDKDSKIRAKYDWLEAEVGKSF